MIDSPLVAGGWARFLDSIRFEEPLEREFRAHFDQQGRASRLQLWLILAIAMASVLVFNRALLKIPPEVIPLGRQLVLGVMLPMVLRWLSAAWAPLQRWSAVLYIGAVFIDIGCLMLLRVVCLRHGYDTVPLMIPVALLMSLIVVQIRFLILAPTIVMGLLLVVGVELWAFDADSNRMFQIAAASALVLVALSPAYELERWARIGWLRERRLRDLARTDGLTGLANRRDFDARLRELLRRAARERRRVAVLLLDVDHFKSFNDHYGHPAGDDCLRAVGRYLRGAMRRPLDFAARLGGEEFAAVWYDPDPAEIQRLAETLRSGIRALGIVPAPGRGQAVTASAGLVHTVAPQAEDDAHHLAIEVMRQADAALYRAKDAGRDRMSVSDGSVSPFEPRSSVPPPVTSLDATAETEARGRWARLVGAVRFAEPRESAFRAHFERQGRASRAQILVGLLGVVVFILLFDRSLLKIPDAARLVGQLTLLIGIAPPALVGLLGCLWPRLQPRSSELYVGAIATIVAAQMIERVLQTPLGYDVVPLMMPIAVLLSLSVAQIRYPLQAPAMILITAAVIVTELLTFPATGSRLLEVATAVMMVLVTLNFSYKVERSTRVAWLRQQRLDERVRTDALTGLANRQHFDGALRETLRSAARERRNVALMILDIDHFKSYNDHYGHPAGDACLAAVGRHLREGMRRPGDFAARLGGEEFAAVWFDAARDEAPRLAEALRCSLGDLGIVPAPGHGQTVTASAGFVQIEPPAADVRIEDLAIHLMRRADVALYNAKRAGRDRFVDAA